ncbi:hypothetical protein EXE23_00170 [Acinetobacter venetianus]|nr:hypothetical protein EXE23_00170 [Acinetobacter venetianus]
MLVQRRHGCRLFGCLALLSKRCFEIAQDVPSAKQRIFAYFSSLKSNASNRLMKKLDKNSVRLRRASIAPFYTQN